MLTKIRKAVWEWIFRTEVSEPLCRVAPDARPLKHPLRLSTKEEIQEERAIHRWCLCKCNEIVLRRGKQLLRKNFLINGEKESSCKTRCFFDHSNSAARSLATKYLYLYKRSEPRHGETREASACVRADKSVGVCARHRETGPPITPH